MLIFPVVALCLFNNILTNIYIYIYILESNVFLIRDPDV